MPGPTQGDRVPEYDADWSCKPLLFRLDIPDEAIAWESFCATYPDLKYDDHLETQVCELMGILDPPAKLTDAGRQERAVAHMAAQGGADFYGTWVVYPWLQRAVKVLPEAEFVRVRTNRNLYKITPSEQETLGKKAIGVIGMSVGKSIARVLTTERTCGEIRIADFDRLALSNMNRIQTSLVNLGLPKTTIVAREIAEQDPYIKVKVFPQGVTKETMEAFLLEGGKLDLLLDECDSIDVKIQCRLAAREHCIPVIMETNDRGMIDIERFDLEPDRELFHGLLGGVDLTGFNGLMSTRDKVRFVDKVIGLEQASSRLKAGMLEIDQSTESWPQLSSEVSHGAGVCSFYSRALLLDQDHRSGRFLHKYDDSEKLVITTEVQKRMSWEDILKVKSELKRISKNKVIQAKAPELEKRVELLTEFVWHTPSAGNLKPWSISTEWKGDGVWVELKKQSSNSSTDIHGRVASISFGCAVEAFFSLCDAFGVGYECEEAGDKLVTVRVLRIEREIDMNWIDLFTKRATIRKHEPEPNPQIYNKIDRLSKYDGLAEVHLLREKNELNRAGAIVGDAERSRILDSNSRQDLFGLELNAGDPSEHDLYTRGLYIDEIARDELDSVALKLFRDEKVGALLQDLKLAGGVREIAQDLIPNSQAFGLLAIRCGLSLGDFYSAGREVFRFWMYAQELDLALHPMCSVPYSFYNLSETQGIEARLLPEEFMSALLQVFSVEADDILVPFCFRVLST